MTCNPRTYYAYWDSFDPRTHTGIDLIVTHVKILIQHVTRGKIADTSETDPCTHTGSPHMRTCVDPEKFAYGESPHA